LRLEVIVALQGREMGYRVGRREYNPEGCEGGTVVDSFGVVLRRRRDEEREAKAMSTE
jgi:hypothetical protein